MIIILKSIVLILLAITLGLFVFSLYQLAWFLYHMFYVISNVTNKYAPILGAFILLNINNFNATGQYHLLKAKPRFIRMFLSLIPALFIMIIVKLIISNVN